MFYIEQENVEYEVAILDHENTKAETRINGITWPAKYRITNPATSEAVEGTFALFCSVGHQDMPSHQGTERMQTFEKNLQQCLITERYNHRPFFRKNNAPYTATCLEA
jgi:hypothetical protein